MFFSGGATMLRPTISVPLESASMIARPGISLPAPITIPAPPIITDGGLTIPTPTETAPVSPESTLAETTPEGVSSEFEVPVPEAVPDATQADILKPFEVSSVPNPYGKNGGLEHQKTIDELEAEMKDRGLETQREEMIRTPEGEKSKRFVDLTGKDPKTGKVERVQVGKQTKKGKVPVARERKALKDIEKATGERPKFVPYN